MTLEHRTAVITGAGSGIGRGIALALARRRCALALVDIDEPGLAQTATLLEPFGVRTSRHRANVADRADVVALPAAVLAAHPGVDWLVNNAGVALGGTFEQVSEPDFEWLFDINFWGVVRTTRAFLPLLRASDDAHLVNLSSVYGLVAPAGQSAYAASKFAVRGFSSALRHELAGTRIAVTVVHPGGVATSIARNARKPRDARPEDIEAAMRRAQRMLRMPPERAGEIIVAGALERRARVLVGNDARFIATLERLMPVSYARVLARVLA